MEKDIATQVIEISEELLRKIELLLQRASQESVQPLYAAFDADGTLWDADAGETFFAWQIRNLKLNLPSDPWKHYEQLKVPDPRVAYGWLAQICAGENLDTVRAWAQASLEVNRPWPVFYSTYRLFDLLRKYKVEIFIVTASVKWAVEPMARLLNVDEQHVLGIVTDIENGIVSKNLVQPVTWRQGKAEALLKHQKGKRPVFAAGNTYGDLFLLESATHCALTISTQNIKNPLFEEEDRLRVEAKGRSWLHHSYRT